MGLAQATRGGPGRHPRRRWLIPETLQASATDCGPACVRSLAAGFGRELSYARLRSLCQTDVDGTSIDSLEEVLGVVGMQAQQLIVPADAVLDRSADLLPAVVLFGRAGGPAHFVVLWRRVGDWVQLMNPAGGRRWARVREVEAELYRHGMRVPEDVWHSWADGLLRPLWRARLAALGISDADAIVGDAIERGRDDPTVTCDLDAAIRLTGQLQRAAAVRRGAPARRLVMGLATSADDDRGDLLDRQRFARPRQQDTVGVHGAVIVRVRPGRGLTSSRTDALAEVELVTPLRTVWGLMRTSTRTVAFAGGVLAALTVVLTTAEALVFRTLLSTDALLSHPLHRALGIVLAALVVAGSAGFRVGAAGLFAWVGRRIEASFRLRLFSAFRSVDPEYLQTRPLVDLAERAHNVHKLRDLPRLVQTFLLGLLGLLGAIGAIAWVDARSGVIAAVGSGVALVTMLALQRPVAAAEMKVRNRDASASRLYLEAMLGHATTRAHGAETALANEYETHLTQWARARVAFLKLTTWQLGQGVLVGFFVVAAIVLDFIHRSPGSGLSLLLVYWSMLLPFYLTLLATVAKDAPDKLNATTRLLEPLVEARSTEPAPRGTCRYARWGARITLRGATVRRCGQAILSAVDLEVAAGEHIAVVGTSGSGKSSLLGAIGGWYAVDDGVLLVDDEPLEGHHAASVRRQTTWIDPANYVWNWSLIDNVRYAHPTAGGEALHTAFGIADLYAALGVLPEGLATPLGEGGGLLSGGEAQRVRVTRGVLKPDVRLVIMDEPFRGLPRTQRQQMLERIRRRYRHTTLLCATHDLEQTLGFARVLVVDAGRVVEDGDPQDLLAQPTSRFRALVEAARAADERVWNGPRWRRWWIGDGALTEEDRQ